MTARERTLDVDALRANVRDELLAWGPSGAESFDLTLEALAVTWPPRPGGRTLLRPIEYPRGVPGGDELRGRVLAACLAAGACFHRGGAWEPGPQAGPWVELGPGGQVIVHSGWQGTPGRAHAEASVLLERVHAGLEAGGVGLVRLGFDPWHALEQRPSQDRSPWGVCRERVYAGIGALGGEALRMTASTRVRLAFGGPIKGPRRWLAAWLLAPRLAALFAHSPLAQGSSSRCKSARGRAWSGADPSRAAFPRSLLDEPALAPHDQYLRLALGARVLWVAREGEAVPQTSPISFAQWLAAGVEGWFPDLADWRAHLATLHPLVRPDGALSLEGIDAQGRAFAGVPLLLAAALLVDDAAVEAVIERFSGDRAQADKLLESGLTDGLLDQDLARDARELFALAADALLRAPPGWASSELLAAFVAFHAGFVRTARTPADDLLEVFLERGELGRAELEALEQRWCAAAGTPVSLLRAARPA